MGQDSGEFRKLMGRKVLTQQGRQKPVQYPFGGVLKVRWGKIPGVRIVIAKTKEWILSIIIERKISPSRRSCMMYLNTVSFRNNAFGIKVAAKTYFDTEVLDLNIPQPALPVGTLQNPTIYNPARFPQNATNRREYGPGPNGPL